jgi:predicted TPR repeat methyltransferase
MSLTPLQYEYEVYRPGSYDDLVWQEEQKILAQELAWLKRRVPAPRYLDFACGTGRIIAYLEDQLGESMGVDISDTMLAIAREKLQRSTLMRTDLTREDTLKGQQFDLITAFRFFLNAEPTLRSAALKILAPKLTSEGVFVFNIHGNTWSFRLLMLMWYRLHGKHISHLSYWRVKALIASYNLKIIRFYGFGVIPKIFYRFLPKAPLLFVDHLLAVIPFVKYFSYNLIFVCQHR